MTGRVCAIENCDRHVTARALCRMHYLREYRAGTHVEKPLRSATERPECPADHAHDIVCWEQHGCRDSRCRHARAMDRQRRRNRLRAYGREDQIAAPQVPAAPVRAHVLALRDAGFGLERIGVAAGVGHGVMMDLIYGPRGARASGPSESIRASYAARLLALTASSIEAALHDPTGTIRRMQALVATGHSETELAAAMGMHTGNFWSLLHGRRRRVTTRTRDAAAALFTERWDRPCSGASADRARRIANLYGWVSPLAWDDIDDPAEVAEGALRRRETRAPAAEVLDDVEFLLSLGESPEQVAAIVGRQPGALAKLAGRNGRTDIARIYWPLAGSAAA